MSDEGTEGGRGGQQGNEGEWERELVHSPIITLIEINVKSPFSS